MTLEQKIKDRIIAYYMRQDKEIAFELGVLYLELAERRIARQGVSAACVESMRWFRAAHVPLPEYLPKLSCWTQREELKKFLAAARVAVPE